MTVLLFVDDSDGISYLSRNSVKFILDKREREIAIESKIEREKIMKPNEFSAQPNTIFFSKLN